MSRMGELATDRVRGFGFTCCAPTWKHLLFAASGALVLCGSPLQAAGLFRTPNSATVSPASRVCGFERFLERDFGRWMVTLPTQHGIELAREAMAISGSFVYFLSGDLGASNRLFRVSFAE